jgi:uncharacterized protein (TIGR02145 family)
MGQIKISVLKVSSGILKRPYFTVLLAFLSVLLLLTSCKKDPTIPVLTTNPASNVTVNSAAISGEITDDGGSPVTTRGICWGTEVDPSIDGLHTNNGAGVGIFSTAITGLSPNTIYHARTYAENNVGIAYGNEIVFITGIAAPELTTTSISEITTSTAVSGGNITYDGGAEITARGVCWSTDPQPDLSDSFTTNGTGAESFNSTMTGLTSGSKYYVRAYAKNSAWTVYGDEVTFNTKIADVEGNLYSTITIGSQMWMAENLRTTKYNNDISIPLVTESADWTTISTPAYCWLRNDIQYKDMYGALYNWYTVYTGDLCPSGWHVPTDEDFKVLELALGMAADQVDLAEWRGTDQGAQMKSTTGWAYGENGTNTSGYSAIPGGYRYAATGAFNGIEMLTYWWSSDFTNDYGWYRRVDGTNNGIFRGATSKKGGKYVRCVKN